MVSAQDFIRELRARKVISEKHLAIIEQSLLQPAAEIPASDLADYLVEQMIISAAVSNTILAHLQEQEKRSLHKPTKAVGETPLIDADGVVKLVPASHGDEVKPLAQQPAPVTPRPVPVPQPRVQEAPQPSVPQPPPSKVRPVTPASPLPPQTPPEPPAELPVVIDDDEKTPMSLKEASWRIKTPKRESQWDTPLVKYGIISLGLLILASVVLVWLLMQRRADEVLAVADEAWGNGNYAQAIDGYNDFIKSFEKNTGVPKAKLRIALSKIRLIAETKSNWDKALACVREELPEMSRLPDFAGEGRTELSAILPSIAEGLATMADKTDNTDLIRQSETALALVEEHVVSSMQPFNQLQATRRSLELTRRRIARDAEIVTLQAEVTDKLNAIKTAASDDRAALRRQLADCYALVTRYLHTHPEMRNDAVAAKIKSDIARTEAQCQIWMPHHAAPVDDVHVSAPPNPVMLLTHHVGPLLDNTSGATAPERLFVCYAGQNVYAINPITGTIAWRYHAGALGLDRNAPLMISGLPNNNTLLTDDRTHSLLMVDGTTGTERLRIALGETALINPQPMWPINFVTTPDGKLMLINLATGERLGHIDIMQDANVPPCYDPERQLVVQPAHHSALHVFRYDVQANVPLANIGIVSTGHLAGTIHSAPVIHKGYLLIAEQTAPTRSTIKVYAPTADGQPVPWPDEPAQMIPLDGLVKSPPLVNDNDLLYMAQRGDVKLISYVGNDPTKLYQIVAEGRIDDTSQQGETVSGRYAAIAGRSLWVADNRLSHFEVQPSRNRLIPQGIPQTPAMISQLPLEVADNHLLQTFVDPVMGGAVARSFALSNLTTNRWQIEFGESVLAQPVTSDATTDDGTLHLVTVTGKLFDVPLNELSAERDATLCNTESYMRQRVASGTLTEPITELVPLANGFEVLCSLSPNTVMTNQPVPSTFRMYDGNSPQSPIRTIAVPAPLTSNVVPLGQGIVVPLANGQLAFYSPADGTVIGNPFVTKRTQDVPPRWSPMTLISKSALGSDANGDDVSLEEAVLVGDADGLLRQIELVTQNNRPSLVVTKSLQLPTGVATKPLVFGRNIITADHERYLLLFDYDQLTAKGNVLPDFKREPAAAQTGQPPSQNTSESPNHPTKVNPQSGGIIITGNVEPQADSPVVINARQRGTTSDSSDDEQPLPATPSATDMPYQAWELDGPVAWGPFPCGTGAAVAVTEHTTFVAVAKADQPTTSRHATLSELPLEHGMPVGQPIAISETQLLFITRQGMLLRYDLTQGTLTPIIETGVTPSCGPVLVQSKIIVIANDGAIYAF